MRRTVVVTVLVGLLSAPGAWAFFPIGEYDATGVLRYVTWRLATLDTNGDGDVGPDEGVEVFIETGPLGFTAEEVDVVEDSFQVWEDVATSYAAAYSGGEYRDLILAGVPDGINTIQLEVALDPSEIQVGVVSDPLLLGLTLLNYTITDTVVDVGGISTIVAGGTILDADVVIDGILHRPLTSGGTAPAELTDTLVHELGHFFGLDHTPNSTVLADTAFGALVEFADFRMRNASGEEVLVGLTPTMFPLLFYSRGRATGAIPGGGAKDLAPDDISGISFLYPRGSQGAFFGVQQKARTQNRVDIPSYPLPGAVITAWVDHDNDASTARQPMMSTMSGLYEFPLNVERAGNFNLYGLWKRIEVEGVLGQVDATYVFTLNPLNSTGYDRMAPPGYLPADFASVTGSLASSAAPIFLSEVFNESGNIIDVSNVEVGTPLQWSSGKAAVVSTDSGRTLAEILPNRGEPMFGDPNRICPFNEISGGGTDTGTDTDTGTKMAGMLRGLRDDVLLESPFGAAFVDAYYSVSPSLANYVAEHRLALRTARWLVGGLERVMDYGYLLAAMVLLALVARAVRFFRRARRPRVAVVTALLVVFLAGLPVFASVTIPATTADFVANADAIVLGTVTAVESRWVNSAKYGRFIVTDVSVEISETAKGTLNKSTTITFTMPGGRIDAIATAASGLASFAEGEESLLYLVEAPNLGYVVIGGSLGKIPVETDKATGGKYVPADALIAGPDPDGAAKELAGKTKQQPDGPSRISLGAYLDYVRGLVDSQAKAGTN